MAEWLGNGLQNHVQQFDSAWHLDLLVISFSVINYVVSMSCPRGMRRRSFFFAYSALETTEIKCTASKYAGSREHGFIDFGFSVY